MAQLNRRSALGALLAAGPALALPAFAQLPVPPTGSRIVPLDDDDGVVIALDAWTDMYGRPTASVKLNGQGPFAFLVDTGSTATVMAERVALQLNAQIAGELTVAGATGTAVRPYTIMDTLQTGAVMKDDLRVAILTEAGLARGDGILGADVFAGKRLVFNIREKRVLVEPSMRTARVAPRGNIKLRQGLLAEVDGRVGKVSAKLMLDTGADFCVANMALGEALKRAHPTQERYPNARITGVTGHRIYGEFVMLPKVDVRAFSVRDSGAVIADAPIFKLWELENEPAMIVGVDLLSRLDSFSIDYGARMFDAKLATASDLIARNDFAFG
jgi:predicted aspartyl protease